MGGGKGTLLDGVDGVDRGLGVDVVDSEEVKRLRRTPRLRRMGCWC